MAANIYVFWTVLLMFSVSSMYTCYSVHKVQARELAQSRAREVNNHGMKQ